MVSAVGDYTPFGWVLLLMGISALPIAIRYQCRRCGQTLERTTDTETIAATRLL